MRTITFSNNKGGSGKTTTVVSVAACFAEMGLRVLVIDLDPQGSATYWLRGEESPTGLVELGNGGIRASQLARSTTVPGLELLPISPSVVASGETTPNDTGLALVRGFARLPDYWDMVVVDTPPTVGYLSLAPIVASRPRRRPRRGARPRPAGRRDRRRDDQARPPAGQPAGRPPGDRGLPGERDAPHAGRRGPAPHEVRVGGPAADSPRVDPPRGGPGAPAPDHAVGAPERRGAGLPGDRPGAARPHGGHGLAAVTWGAAGACTCARVRWRLPGSPRCVALHRPAPT